MIPAALLQNVSPVKADSNWTKFTGSMSLNDKYVLDSCVIKDPITGTYKMWYTRLSFDMSVSQLFTDIKAVIRGLF
jgi:hypothetical protein